MIAFYKAIVYKPMLNLLIWLYQYVAMKDLGISIILLTLVVRFVLYPFFYKGARDQAIMQKIAPRVKEIQKKHKEDKQKQMEELMALYKEHEVNPFSSIFLLLLVQLPIMIALFQLFVRGIKDIPQDLLYPFVAYPGQLQHMFLGIMDLSKPNLVLVALAAAAQYWQSKLMLPKNGKALKDLEPAEMMARQMSVLGPIMTVLVLFKMPAAVGLYWLTTTVFSAIQQIIINRKINIVKDHGKLVVGGDR